MTENDQPTGNWADEEIDRLCEQVDQVARERSLHRPTEEPKQTEKKE